MGVHMGNRSFRVGRRHHEYVRYEKRNNYQFYMGKNKVCNAHSSLSHTLMIGLESDTKMRMFQDKVVF